MAVILRTAALLTGAAAVTPGFTSMWWLPGTVGGSTADATDCLDRFRDVWEAVKSIIDDGYSIDYDPICIAVDAATGALTGAFAGTEPGTTVCTGATDALPRQTQGLVRLGTSTVINGRRVRGRMFVPGPLEVANDVNGLPTSGYTTSVTAAFASILAAGATASSPVIWHRPVGGSGGASPLITSVGTSPTWSVLRSRRS